MSTDNSYIATRSGYLALQNTYGNQSRDFHFQPQQSTIYNSPVNNFSVPNQSTEIVTRNDAFLKQHYYSLLHKTPDDHRDTYTSSGYFGITGAYPSRCTVPVYRNCAKTPAQVFMSQ